MAVATQICTEVAIRDIDDYTIAFRFVSEKGADAFVSEVSLYEGRLSFLRLGLEILESII